MAPRKRRAPAKTKSPPRKGSNRLSVIILTLIGASLAIGAYGYYFNNQTPDLSQQVSGIQATFDLPTQAPPPTPDAPVQALPLAGTPIATASAKLDKTENILLLGSDRRPDDPVWRTDVMMIVFLDTANGRAAILSLPRDLYVNIPTRGMDRINIADFWGEYTKYPGGGPGLAAKVIADSFGIRIDKYARVDFDGFKRIVDTVGGVDVNVPCELEDDFINPDSPTGYTHLHVDAGIQHMNGDTALMYVRQRHNTGDIDRDQRQQRVVFALREKLLSPDIVGKIPQLYAQLQDSIQTDFGTIDLPGLVQAGLNIKPGNIRGRVIDQTMWNFYNTPDGKSVLVYDKAKVRAAVDDLFNAPPINASKQTCS